MFRSSHKSRSGEITSGLPMDDLQVCAVVNRYQQSEPIGEHQCPTEHWHRVVSGAVRQYAIKSDGRRQIIDLLLPGDYFGLAAPDGECFGAEAIMEGTELLSYPWRRLEHLANSNPDVALRIRDGAFETIARLQRQLLVLGRVKACEKLGSFLLELKERLPLNAGEEVSLPVSRYDIADYLAISVETVSRSMTDLQHRGAIRLEGTRRIKIVDRDAFDLPARH